MNKKTKEEIIMDEIESYVNSEVNYIDALVHYSSIHNIEIELMGEIVRKSVNLKSKVAENAELLRLKERTAVLPI